MTIFRNLKIQINDQQPIGEVVKALESKCYIKVCEIYHDDNLVGCDEGGLFFATNSTYLDVETTLSELKEM